MAMTKKDKERLDRLEEKYREAVIMAQRMKCMAQRLSFDANDFGVLFPKAYAKELTEMSEDFLKKRRTTK